jgi:aromatic-L-amino-acid decarboxylase
VLDPESRAELELLADVPLNVVCFRYRTEDFSEESLNALNKELLMRLQESGIAVISSTVLEGQFALRAAITNHRSKREDFQILADAVVKIGQKIEKDFRCNH